jgi:general secretion pathway protein F/type IV pilus assembly protein PilC
VLLVGATGAVTFLMAFVVPQVRNVIQGDLPLPTRIVFGLSDFITQQYTTLLGIIVAIIVLGFAYMQSEMGKRQWTRLQLRLPGLGKVYTMVSLCRFCRVFGTLLANGIPILVALKIAKDSTGNAVLAEAIESAAENVRSGEPLAIPLQQSKVFPPAIVDMIAVAEESNTLDKVLVEIANTQEERTARQIDIVMKLVEPILLLLMGVMVMFIAIALLVPILRMGTQGIK